MTVVAVVAGFVDGDADDVLGGLGVDILREHALVMNHFAFASGDGEVDLALFCLGLLRGGFGGFGLGGFLLFLGGVVFGWFVLDEISVFATRSKVGVEVALLGFFEAFFDVG